ncbi:MAG: hypothetical protein IRY97_03065, partial [Thermomicrobiaceae bacterium]|nr:hypothetical protein [Thermomicrobiaceae bacterium]
MSSEPRFGWRPDLDPESTPSRPVETPNEPVPATDGGRLAGANPDAAPGETSELTRAAIRLWSPTPDAPTAEERARAARRLSATPALYAGAVVLIAMVLTAYGYWGREQPARSAQPTVTQTATGGESGGGPSSGQAAVGLAPPPPSAATP